MGAWAMVVTGATFGALFDGIRCRRRECQGDSAAAPPLVGPRGPPVSWIVVLLIARRIDVVVDEADDRQVSSVFRRRPVAGPPVLADDLRVKVVVPERIRRTCGPKASAS